VDFIYRRFNPANTCSTNERHCRRTQNSQIPVTCDIARPVIKKVIWRLRQIITAIRKRFTRGLRTSFHINNVLHDNITRRRNTVV